MANYIAGSEYTHKATDSDTLQTIAASLRSKINLDANTPNARSNQYLDVFVLDIDPITRKPIEDTVHFRGEQESGYVETAYQLYGYSVKGYDNGGTLVFDDSHANSAVLFEDALGQITTTDSGKEVIVVTANTHADAVPLFRAANGTLTTNPTSGVPSPSNRTIIGHIRSSLSG